MASRGAELAVNTIWIGLARFAAKVIGLVMLPVYTRVLSADQYGTVDLLVTCAALFVPLVTVQTETALFRFLIDARKDPQRQVRVVTCCVLTTVALAGAGCALLAVASLWAPIAHGAWFLAYALSVALSGLAAQLARGLGRNRLFASSSVVGAALTLAGNLWLVVGCRLGVDGMVASLVAANLGVVAVVAVRVRVWRLVRLASYRLGQLRELWAYSAPLVPSGVSWWVINVSDRVIIAWALTVATVGVYGVASRFAMAMEFVVGVFALSWAEQASLHIDDPDRDRYLTRVLDAAVRLFGSALLCVCAGTAAVFDLVVGAGFTEAYQYVPLLLAASGCHGLVELYTGLYIGAKRTGRAALTSVAAAVVNLVVNLALIRFAGLWAAAAATLAAFAFLAAARHLDLRRVVTIRYDWRPAALLALAGAAVAVCYYLRAPAAVLCGCLVAAAAAGWLNRRLLRRAAVAIRRRSRREPRPDFDVRAIISGGYDVASGVFSAVSPDVRTELDPCGRYVTRVPAAGPAAGWAALDRVAAMSGAHPGVAAIAAELYGRRPGASHAPHVGWHVGLWAGHIVEGDYRSRGSSGGIATWLACQLLDRGLIDGLVHVKPSPAGGPLFTYQLSRTAEQIRAGASSRYYPVELSAVLAEVRDAPGRYALVGIPSVVFEVRLLARHDPVYAERIAYLIGLVCGHQKTTAYADALAWESGIVPGALTGIDFRVKTGSPPAYDYLTRMTGRIDGRPASVVKRQDELFAADWGRGMFKAAFSDYTDDALGEAADITLGDAWIPPWTRDPDGTNIVICRHPDLQRILDEGAAAGAVSLAAITVADVERSQAGLIRHTQDLGWRLRRQDQRGRWRPVTRMAATTRIPWTRKAVQAIRGRIAERSHDHYRRAVALADWGHFRRRMRPWALLYDATQSVIACGGLLRRVAERVRDDGFRRTIRAAVSSRRVAVLRSRPRHR